MRVVAVLTIDGKNETVIEGTSPFMEGEPGDKLEEAGLGVWLSNWRSDGRGRPRRGKVFLPWTSVLYCEERGEKECSF